MEKIEISPEWILDKLTVTHHADGEGNITISADSVSDSHWIDLALDTLKIKYKTVTVGYDPDTEKQYFEVQWEFKIENIKTECPNLYAKWKIMDEKAYRLWEVQRLMDSSKKEELRQTGDAENL